MARFVYAAWFRDDSLPPDGQDHEWVACFFVDAERGSDAQAWGDHLAAGRVSRLPGEPFIRSEVRSPADPYYAGCTLELPAVAYGTEVSDVFIGW